MRGRDLHRAAETVRVRGSNYAPSTLQTVAKQHDVAEGMALVIMGCSQHHMLQVDTKLKALKLYAVMDRQPAWCVWLICCSHNHTARNTIYDTGSAVMIFPQL